MLCQKYFNIICEYSPNIGCRVIGFAGTDDKCQTLLNKYGFDKAYNYKKVS